MKLAAIFTLTFFGFTVWTLIHAPWVAPAPALFTAASACLIQIERCRRRGESVPRLVYTRITFVYFGMAWFVGCIGGRPDTLAFWVLFGAVCTIFAPLLTVMWKSSQQSQRPKDG